MALKQVRAAVENTIKIGKPEFNVYRRVPARPVYPAVVVIPSNDTTGFPETMNGMTWMIDVHVFFAYADMASAQDNLDDEVDPSIPTSTWSLLKKDYTLGGTVDDSAPIQVMEYGQAGAEEAGGAPFIGLKIRLEVRETC